MSSPKLDGVTFRSAAIAVVLGLSAGTAAAQVEAAQDSWSPSRTVLQARLATSEGLATSSAYGDRLRARAAEQSARIRERLQRGDFRVGDRVVVRVTGSVAVNDTVTVTEGPAITVASFGELPLAGVLRSELEVKLRERVAASVLDATVTVTPLLRIAVFGSVGTPGYLAVPPEIRLDELLMRAGGPAEDADPARVQIIRGEAVVLDGPGVVSAIAAGATIAGLGLEEGDYLLVAPRNPPWERAQTLQLASLFIAPLLTVLLFR